jgi:uncharacterized membrane protein
MTDTGRLETFADGVFAIAITLLVLGIRVPEADETLAKALADQWPSFFAYVISFLTIGIMWVQHHRLFTVIGRSNPTFAMINIVFLMFIAFVPYPTEVLAQHVNHDGWTLATFLYGGTMVVIAIMFNAIWAYAASRNGHLLDENVATAVRDSGARGYWLGPPLYGVITLLALVNPVLSLIGFGAFALYWALPISGVLSGTD